MIIQCESCSRKFLVKDTDIPKEGRMVQCSNCSQKWFQAPVKIQSSIDTRYRQKRLQKWNSRHRTAEFTGLWVGSGQRY